MSKCMQVKLHFTEGSGPRAITERKSGGTPIPQSGAFDLQGPETMSFVFILHLGCGLLFSEIIEINGEFEGEAERSHRIQ